jgi:hypothetical protein
MLDKLGVPSETVGDSTGRLAYLSDIRGYFPLKRIRAPTFISRGDPIVVGCVPT